MEPLTINLPDLGALAEQFGPQGYIVGHIVAALIFGAFAFRQISLAGKCHGEGCADSNNAKTREEKARAAVGDSHIWRGAISGVIGVINMIMVLVMSANLFDAALSKVTTSSAYQSSAITGQTGRLAPFTITSGDGYSFAIYTSNPLSDHDLRSLKILGAETTRLDRVAALSEFLNRCKSRGIRVTTIVHGGEAIYDNPKNEEVGEITQIPCIVWGGESERVVTAAESGGVVATSYVSGAKEK